MYPPRRSIFELLAGSSPDTLEDALTQSRIQKLLPGLTIPHPGLQARLPYTLTIH